MSGCCHGCETLMMGRQAANRPPGGMRFSLASGTKASSGRAPRAHRDEPRGSRSRDLQAPGPRTGATRVLDKFVTRQKKDGSWEKVDHETLKVRACADPNADEGDY